MQPQPAVVALLDHVDARAPEIAAAMAEAILAEVEPMKAVSRNDPNFRPRFEAFCEQHVRTFIQTTRAGRTAGAADLEFVREVAVRRAEDAFPLPELMEGLRVGHRGWRHSAPVRWPAAAQATRPWPTRSSPTSSVV